MRVNRVIWRTWIDWRGRLRELGELGGDERGAYIETKILASSALADAWRRLPPIPMILTATHGGEALRLQYAALCGCYERVLALSEDAVDFALDLATALISLLDAVSDRAPFTNPHAYVDFNGQARIAFAEPAGDADVREAGFVKAFARMLDEIVDFTNAPKVDSFTKLIDRCRAGEESDLGAVRKRLRGIKRQSYAPTDAASWNAWLDLETMVGYVAIGYEEVARSLAQGSTRRWASGSLAESLVDELKSSPTWRRLDFTSSWPSPPAPPRTVDLATLDQTRDYAAAITFIRHRGIQGDIDQRTIARCYLELHQYEPALQHARLAKPSAARYALEVEALLALRQTDGLLAVADAWLAIAPDEPRAHNARAHALLALGKPADARAAHERAAQLGSVASQFARTNLDRAVKRLQSVAGTQGYRELPVPEHLKDLVPLLSQGRLLDAILWLTERYDDPDARALLASCYEYAGDAESALHVHEADDNRAGIARCLVALGRREEAFARTGDDPALLDELRELVGEPSQRIAWTR